MKGCYWCKRRKGVICTLAKRDAKKRLINHLMSCGFPILEESFKNAIPHTHSLYIGELCEDFAPKIEKEKVVFT